MKDLINQIPRIFVLGTALSLLCVPVRASDTNSSSFAEISPQPPIVVVEPPAQVASAPPKLPYGVDDVLKLSRAQISDDIVLNYIQNSGTIYSLSPQDIVYLKSQGVSDRVMNAMLDQRKRATEVAAQAAAPSIANSPTIADAPAAPVAPDYAQVAPQPAPTSSVYAIPSQPYATYGYYSPYYGSYGYYPYYGGYYGPSIAFGFGFGGYGHSHGGYHGGYHGYHGGYSHGGGGHHH